MITLYHITSDENYYSIKEHGLVAKIGSNSGLCQEKKSRIFLSDKASLPYWYILLARPNSVILEVKLNSYPRKFQYGLYKEYVASKSIPPDRIRLSGVISPSGITEAMKELCESYAYDLGHVCIRLIRYYEGQIDYATLDARYLSIYVGVLSRLDFSCLTQDEWRAYFRELGESGIYTFLDSYEVAGKPECSSLWLKLTTYPPDELSPLRNAMVSFIKANFPRCLDMNTGGWTG